MNLTIEPTETLHATYQQLVGRPVELDYLKRQMWSVWKNYCKHDPFTEQDLRLVIKYIKFKINKGDNKPSRLLFRNLIESPDYFQEERTDARGWSRTPNANPAKDSVLRAMGRPAMARETKSASAAQVMENHKQMAEMLAEWRAKNL